jgi:hypothetical protein
MMCQIGERPIGFHSDLGQEMRWQRRRPTVEWLFAFPWQGPRAITSERRPELPALAQGGADDRSTVRYQRPQAGRDLTDNIVEFAPAFDKSGTNVHQSPGRDEDAHRHVPVHEAREDAELFPKLRSIVSTIEFGSSAEDFERDERQKFGQDGFEMMVERVKHLENELGIDDLPRVTLA